MNKKMKKSGNLQNSISNLNLSALLNSIDSAIVLLDTEGKVIYYNKPLIKLWKLPTGLNLLSKRYDKLSNLLNQLKDRRKFKKQFESIFERNFRRKTNNLILKNDRTLKQTIKKIKIGKNKSAILITYIEYDRHLTGNDKYEFQINFLNKYLYPIELPVFFINSAGKYIWFNAAFGKTFGVSKDEILNKPISRIANREIKSISKNIKSISSNSGYQANELELKYSSGSINETIIISTKSADKKGNVNGTIGILKNVSEERKYHKLFIDSEKKHEDSNASKNKFFSILAHDLRNPFSVILGITKFLGENMNDFSRAELKESLLKLNESSEHLYTLFENLLDWSRIQRGKVSYEPQMIDLKETSKISLFAVMLTASEKKINIKNTIRSGRYIYADKKMFEMVLRNIVTNAIKYSKPNSDIIISAKKFDSKYIQISVKDFGVGISKSIKKHLFQIEHKVSTPGTNNETGTGLGLILCREFINIHGGNIWVDSEKGRGSEFIFTLPKY